MDKYDQTQLRNMIIGTIALISIYCISGVFH
jgi:hypothetical protein